jgi:hypothetical protein
MRAAIALIAATVALSVSGCGSDDENAAQTTTTPPLAAPTTSTNPAPTTPGGDDPATATNGGQEVPPGGESGGTPAPNSGSRHDSPDNDTAPKPGSAADRFEQQCRETPAACD